MLIGCVYFEASGASETQPMKSLMTFEPGYFQNITKEYYSLILRNLEKFDN